MLCFFFFFFFLPPPLPSPLPPPVVFVVVCSDGNRAAASEAWRIGISSSLFSSTSTLPPFFRATSLVVTTVGATILLFDFSISSGANSSFSALPFARFFAVVCFFSLFASVCTFSFSSSSSSSSLSLPLSSSCSSSSVSNDPFGAFSSFFFSFLSPTVSTKLCSAKCCLNKSLFDLFSATFVIPFPPPLPPPSPSPSPPALPLLAAALLPPPPLLLLLLTTFFIAAFLYFSKTLSISPSFALEEYWNALLFELTMTKAMSQSHKTDNSIAFFIKPFFRFVNVTCRFRSSLMRSMRIFFRPIDLFYTLSSVFLSVFSGSQSREREKKEEEKSQDLTFKRFRNQDYSPGKPR